MSLPQPPPPPPTSLFSFSQPFTYTSDADLSTFASQFSDLSSNMNSIFPTDSAQRSSIAASVSSKQASMLSALSASTASLTASTLETVTTPTSQPSSVVAISSASSTATAAVASSSANSQITSTASTASSSSLSSVSSSATAGATNELHRESAGGMSSPGMQAAVAVPVVVVVLAILALIFLCMRRRKRRAATVAQGETEKQAPMSRNKKWTRHLRVFSFDAELLMGGRYSSTNSIRSRQTGSLRSASRSQNSEAPSVHSVEEVAPPYRDAVSAAHPPNISTVMATAAPGAAAGVNRSASSATAPPPYGAAAGKLASPPVQTSPTSPRQNPFADNSPVSPIEGSPFNDPPETTPGVSRNSSIYQNDRDDTSTIGGVSEAASIREATVARNASIMSGGRVIDDVGHKST